MDEQRIREIMQEELKVILDRAEKIQSTQNYITLTPTVQVTMGDINTPADINYVIQRIGEAMEREVNILGKASYDASTKSASDESFEVGVSNYEIKQDLDVGKLLLELSCSNPEGDAKQYGRFMDDFNAFLTDKGYAFPKLQT